VALWPAMVMGEELDILEKIFLEERRYFWRKNVEDNGRMEKFGEFGGRKRKERKRKKEKKMKRGRYFLERKSENN